MGKTVRCLFESPIRVGRVRKDVTWEMYRTGIIIIGEEKFQGYSVMDAVALWRRKHPARVKITRQA